MEPNGLSASLKLIAATALWCVRRAPLDHSLSACGRPRHTRQAAIKFSTHPCRAEPLPAEPLSWDFDDEKPTTTEPAAAGRRALVDLEPTPSGSLLYHRSRPQPSQCGRPLRRIPSRHPVRPRRLASQRLSRPRSLRPRRLAAAVEPPKITARWSTPSPDLHRPNRSYRRGSHSTAHPDGAAGPTGQLRPPIVQQRRYLGRQRCLDQARNQARRAAVQTPSQKRTATTPRPGSGQTVHRAAAPAVHRARPSTWTVHHEVPPIIVDRLIKSYNGTLAVHNLSFMVEPGRVTGFLGPNGAGKTTTMRILVGLVTPTTGTATFGDLAYADLPHPQRTVGMRARCALPPRP